MIFSCACLLNLWAAPREISVQEVKTSPLIPVYEPILLDSSDVNQKKFETKTLLQTTVGFDDVRNATTRFSASDSVFTFEKLPSPSDRQTKAVQLLSFFIDADRYGKAKLSLTSTDMLEVYVNSKKEKSKESFEDSLSKAKTIEVDLTLEPKRYEVIIKRLTDLESKNPAQLKLKIKPDKADSLLQISASLDGKRRMIIDDILDGHRVTGGSISPTGRYYLVNTTEVFPGNKRNTKIELKDLKTGKILTRFPTGTSLNWSPAGKDELIYSQQSAENRDLICLDIATMTETVLAKDVKFGAFHLSTDKKFFLFSQRDEIPADKGDLKRVLSPSDRSGAYRGRSSLFRFSIPDQTAQRLSFGRTGVNVSDVRRDGKKALLITRKETITQRPFSEQMLLELDLQTLTVDTILTDRFLSGADYSPDGNQLLLLGGPEAFGGVGLKIADGQIANSYDTQAFIYDVKNKTITPISKDFDPTIEDAEWSVYDKNIYFRVEDKDYVRVYQYHPNSKQYTLLDLPEEVISSFSLAETQGLAVFRGESATNSARLYAYDLKTKRSTLLEDPYKAQLEELDLSKPIDWSFVSAGNTTIEGRYYLPPNFDETKQYPLIVYYYGGTNPTSRRFEFSYPMPVYAAMGYVVYVVQPSGATGFGQEFSARHVNAWGKITADEIIEGTQRFFREHAFIDSTKVGCVGASYGGFMTQYLQTQTKIFAAAVSHAGISDITSYWGEGYWGYSYSSAASANSYPWNNPELYVNQSPLFHADQINTPLLLLHGTVDTNVPIGESIQMYNALKILGKEVEFITVEGENHGIADYKKRIEWNKTIFAWFNRWLKGEPEWWNALYPAR